MEFVWTVLVGFTAGLVARAMLPGPTAMGFLMTSIVGIIGSVLATYLGQFMGWYHSAQGAGFIASVAGALALLGICRLLVKGRRRYS